MQAVALDHAAVARRALRPGAVPDDVFHDALAGARYGDSVTDPTYRREYRRLVDAWCAGGGLLPLTRQGVLREVSDTDIARAMWRAYDRGQSQREAARSLGIRMGSLQTTGHRLGFVLQRDARNKAAWRLVRGPCLGCMEPYPVAKLDGARVCEGCR